MTTIVRVSPTSQPFLAWLFIGQRREEWPAWVQVCCTMHKGADGSLELRHDRQSGKQVVYIGEYLVKDLDGGVVFYTEEEYRREFVTA